MAQILYLWKARGETPPNDPPKDPETPNPSQYPEEVPNEVPVTEPLGVPVPQDSNQPIGSSLSCLKARLNPSISLINPGENPEWTLRRKVLWKTTDQPVS